MAASELQPDVEVSSLGRGDEESQTSESDAPINNLVHAIFTEGIRRRASDIHLEPLEKIFRVRYRVDGVLLEGLPPPKRLQAAIFSGLKIMANISLQKSVCRRMDEFRSSRRVARLICACLRCPRFTVKAL